MSTVPSWTITYDDQRTPVLDGHIETGPVEYLRSERAVKPDPAWRATDTHGHEHRWHGDPPTLPTLVRSTEHVDCDGSCGGTCGGEGYERTVWHCARCGDPVEPGYVPDWTAREIGTPVVLGPAVAELVVESWRPALGDAVDAVLHADGDVLSGKAWSTSRERRVGTGEDRERVYVSMTLADGDRRG